ncbi:SRPBCC family protein [Jannaschia formosa]|uniref:SRPBCC family protein n=1 Tax=Jannaschia formosa TaxID=2259592 RepID=UPI001430D8F3|nr:SRPBCC family protein [Jannaschia formosa]
MKLSRSIGIAAPPALVWERTADVVAWPDWMPTVTRVRALDGPLRPGARFAVAQPMQREAVWQVTRLESGRLFEWERRDGGRLLFTGTHAVEPEGTGTRATTALEAHAPSAALLRPLFAWVLWTEARALRRRCLRPPAAEAQT